MDIPLCVSQAGLMNFIVVTRDVDTGFRIFHSCIEMAREISFRSRTTRTSGTELLLPRRGDRPMGRENEVGVEDQLQVIVLSCHFIGLIY